MSNYWNTPGVPHRGWILSNVIDVREDGKSADETDYEVCMMCGNERIRYVHVLEHPDLDESYYVGCVCAEKMTNDYINPGLRERELRNKTNRRTNWIKRKWRESRQGNPFLNIDGHNLVVFYDHKFDCFKCQIDNTFGTLKYKTIKDAKIGLFKKIEEMKDKGKW